MSDAKLFAGHAVRRLRRASGLTQAEMAQSLSVSPSYLNLIERNQRPLTGTVIVRLAERFDFDPRSLSGVGPGGGMEAIRKRLADPLFADLVKKVELLGGKKRFDRVTTPKWYVDWDNSGVGEGARAQIK